MIKPLPLYLLAFLVLFVSCDQEKETPNFDVDQDYQPLEIGNFWIYEVDETIFFGENDSETDQFFYRDRVRTSFLNAENEMTYIVQRSKSPNRQNWVTELEYTLLFRDRSLLRTVNNTPIIPLVFPPTMGRIWNGKAYQAEGNDDFELVEAEPGVISGFEGVELVRVNQENLDDKITTRDIRYEIFGKGVGLLEKYDEVITYCSRNDCLGQELIDGGSKTHLKLVEYGKD
ncbi:hypothetical protein [Algoriphagus boritolerans]|uniref:Uncharacterized protein n=1 Tax=Algoriphagus boritolerans DSM 17298 = JCM 18970 TaxID=1120964 RepID=A0A1H5TS89_9BACT|nr:hypothetical protein [Algoriphagus boritolerans]SEF65088.1 hypothetical protein SAMN03080598_00888 [Algoriphagus boritolerans DSM 17298 = JCM 18970]